MAISRAGYVLRCDATWSKIVRAVDGACVLCGSTERPTCGHLFSRTSYGTRYHPMNSWQQDAGCNMRHEHDAYPYNHWFIERFGLTAWDDLHALASRPSRVKTWMLADTWKMMTELLQEVEKSGMDRETLHQRAEAWGKYFWTT